MSEANKETRPALVSRALRRAIVFCEGAITGKTCRDLAKGETPRDLKREAAAYRELFRTLQPSAKGESHVQKG